MQEELRELYIDELRDLYNAENQLVKALPKMAKAASNEQLSQAFEDHLLETTEHVARLEQIFELLGEKPTGKKCMGMEGLVKEGSETMKEDYEDAVKDAAIIGAAQRVEHYEMAGYGTVKAFAELLGEDDHVSLLEQTLEEEKAADQKLSDLAEEINQEAIGGEEAGEDEEGEEVGEAAASKPARGNSKSKRVA